MIKKTGLPIVAIFALAATLVSCSSNKGSGSTTAAATGGVVNGTGGATTATSGGSAMGGFSGIVAASGGAIGIGGASTATGGAATGGSSGIPSGSGGVNGTGGAITATGGVKPSSGGAQNGTGGGTVAIPNGGSSPATGGTPGNGGALGTGGTSRLAMGGTPAAGGAASGGTTSVDPSVSAAISACIDKLPYGGNLLSAAERAPIITAIINTCSVFAPPGANWQTWCQMFLVGAINAESSFNTHAGATGASGDPSVGLLQIRFSSVVTDFANYGPIDTLTRIGCSFGTVTSSDSYATQSAMMLDVNCNIAIGAWYYFIFASGNGGSTSVWVDQYCAGGGIAGTLHIGMACFLMGADAAHSSLSGAAYYYNEIKGWFDPCVTYTGTHPFELPIQPDTSQYCG